MEGKEEILRAISEIKESIVNLESKMDSGFRMVHKRIDGVEGEIALLKHEISLVKHEISLVNHEIALVKLELRKIDTVLHYSEQYDNIPS